MKLNDIILSLQADVSGGQVNQSNSIDSGYLKKMINSYRANYIKMDYYKSSPQILNPSCYQTVYLKYDQNLQYSAPQGSVIFKVPKFIGFGNEDGIRYAGTLQGIDAGLPVTDRVCINQWTRLYNRAKLSTIQRHPYTKLSNNPDDVYFLLDNNLGRLEVYNDPLVTEGKIEGVISNPMDAINFNVKTDEYPISEDGIEWIREVIYSQRTSIDKASPVDNKFNVATQDPIRPPYQKFPQQQPQQ